MARGSLLLTCIAAATAMAACGGGGASAPADAGTHSTYLDIHDTWITTTGEEHRPIDDAKIRLYSPSAPAVDLRMPHVGPGLYESWELPFGPYMIGLDAQTFFVTAADHLDGGSDHVGRTVKNADGGTRVALTVDGLAPWGAYDTLQLVSGNAHTFEDLGYGLTPVPALGDTALNGVMGDASYYPLVDTTLGDDAILVQVSSGGAYSRIVRAGPVPTLTVMNAASAPLAATLTAPPELSLSFDLRGTQFAALLDTPSSIHIGVAAQPGGVGRGVFDAFDSPPLIDAYVPAADGTQTFAYANPYPAFFAPYLEAGAYFILDYRLPGTTTSTAAGKITMSYALDQLDGPVAPVVGPPQSVQINGLDARGPLDGVGVMPTLSWTAPALGTPTTYVVKISRLEAYDTFTFDWPVATITTTDTSVTLPPAEIEAGTTYFAIIEAVNAPHDDPTALNRHTLPYAAADAATGMFTP